MRTVTEELSLEKVEAEGGFGLWWELAADEFFASLQVVENGKPPATAVVTVQVSNLRTEEAAEDIDGSLTVPTGGSKTGVGMVQEITLRGVRFVRAAVTTAESGVSVKLVWNFRKGNPWRT